MRAMIAGAAMLALTGCTLTRMRGFDALAATSEVVEVRGIGAGQGGAFRLSTGAEGRFTRHLVTASEWRTRFDQPLGGTTRIADASFTVAGPGVGGRLEGRCRGEQVEYRDRTRIGSVAIETTETDLPLRYSCRFTRDGRPVGGMVLDEVAPEGFGIMERRAGETMLDGRRLELVSEHRVDGPSLVGGTATPLGYRFEEDGRATGMVSLNGVRRIALPRDPAARDAALAAGLALAFFWDPANF